jgi:CheY-like chemotaxis protein
MAEAVADVGCGPTARVVAVIQDLFFVGKVKELCRQAGAAVDFTSSTERTLQAAFGRPALILVDLNAGGLQPLTLVTALKRDPHLSHIPILGFVSHIQTDLRQQAQEAGCDWVIPRSALSHDLPQILEKCLQKTE